MRLLRGSKIALKRAVPTHLHDRRTPRLQPVSMTRRDKDEISLRIGLRRIRVDRISHPEIQSARHHRHVFSGGMPMQRNLVAVGEGQTQHEPSRRGRIAVQNADLRTWGEAR